ncbi:MAG: hypothetical protein Kow0099_12660 [Candidatus Abyssubacteria bacterium]
MTFDIFPFVGRNDPGCYHDSHNFLRPHLNRYDHALVVFDYAGCGQAGTSESIAQIVQERLLQTGWRSAEVVVIEPELEMWIWSDSSEVSQCLGWINQSTDLKSFLFSQDLWKENDPKPCDPKKALETVLFRMNKPRSSTIYYELARRVSFNRCTDSAFNRLREILKTWFGS